VIGESPGLNTWTDVLKNDPKLPGREPTTGRKPCGPPGAAGVTVAVPVSAWVGVFVRVGVRVRVTVGLADALGVSVIIGVTVIVGGAGGVDVAVAARVWVVVGVSVAAAVVVGVVVGVCAAAVHKPNAAKRRPHAAASRGPFVQTRLSWNAKPFARIMGPSGGSTRVRAMERVNGRR